MSENDLSDSRLDAALQSFYSDVDCDREKLSQNS